MPDKVSVIIPCYNQAEFLPTAVESVLAQTYSNYEIVIVNDGSTDHTAAVASAYAGRQTPGENFIKVVHQANMGLPIARNAGIHASSARSYEYILPLDADDWIEPNHLEKTVAAMQTDPIGGADVMVVGTCTACFGIKEYAWHVPAEVSVEMLMRDNCVPVCSLIRRRALTETGGYNRELNSGYEDWNLWIDIAKRGWRIVNLPEQLFHYREKPNSMLKEATNRRGELVAKIHSLHPELWPPDGSRSMLNKWLGHRKATSGGEFYGVEETYSKAAAFIADGPVEDWGCGTCYARKFFTNGYTGVDGTPDYCDRTAELARYTSNTHGILLRHVLEHNFDWEAVLKNALASCRKLAIVTCTPFSDVTRLLRVDEFGIPIFTFRKEDLTKHFPAYTEEIVQGPAWGQNVTETIFYVDCK